LYPLEEFCREVVAVVRKREAPLSEVARVVGVSERYIYR
jgi:DNA-directed RNA polymerase specialized sigma subunit